MTHLPFDPDTGDVIGRGREWDIALAVAAGGALGGAARYALNLAVGPGPWATFLENVIGSLLLGVVMVVLLEVLRAHRYTRPFLAVGVLGGFTTFSAYIADAHQLIADGRTPAALLYLAGSVLAGLLACALGIVGTRRLVWSGR